VCGVSCAYFQYILQSKKYGFRKNSTSAFKVRINCLGVRGVLFVVRYLQRKKNWKHVTHKLPTPLHVPLGIGRFPHDFLPCRNLRWGLCSRSKAQPFPHRGLKFLGINEGFYQYYFYTILNTVTSLTRDIRC